MTTPLFRQEALDHQREPVRGNVLLAASPRTTWLSVATFVVAATLIAYAWFGEFHRKAHVQGYLAPNLGLIKVYPPVRGTVLERRVDEGAKVRKGDVLAVISTERGSLSVDAANDAAIALLRERQASLEKELSDRHDLARLRTTRIDEQLLSLDEERHQLDDTIETLTSRLKTAEKEQRRFSQLESKGFVANTQLQQQRDRVLDQRSRLQMLERERIGLEGRVKDLRGERATAQLEGEATQSALRRQIAQVRQERTEYESNSDVVVRAPADGVVSSVLIAPGQPARNETPLLSIIPGNAELEAKLLVPSHAIGFIEAQQPVALRYGAFPYQRFGHYQGVVTSIAKSLLLPGDAKLPLALNEPAYVVTVALDAQDVHAYGKDFSLQAGMALDADITLDRRSVIEWIFDPLFSLAQRT